MLWKPLPAKTESLRQSSQAQLEAIRGGSDTFVALSLRKKSEQNGSIENTCTEAQAGWALLITTAP
jgi:hypothetical protein